MKTSAFCGVLAREAPLLPAALLLLAGAGIGRAFTPELPVPAWSAAGLLALLLAGLRAAPDRFARHVPVRDVRMAGSLALLLLGMRAGAPAPVPRLPATEEPLRYLCTLRGPVNHGPAAWWVRAQCRDGRNGTAPAAPLLLRGFGPPPDWRPGGVIEADGVIREIPPLRNFGVPAQESEPALLLKSLRLTRVISPGNPLSLDPLHARLASALAGLDLSPDLRAAAQGMLLGGRADLPAPLRGLHQRLSTFHLFIVAGLHLGLALLLARGMLRLVFCPPAACDLILLGLLLGYFFLLDGEVAIRRALCFGALYLIARLTGRDRPALNAWALALIAETLFSPAALFTLGFQLSYVASFGMILQPRRGEMEVTKSRGRLLSRWLLMPWRVAGWLLPVQSALGPLPLLGPLANSAVFVLGEALLALLWLALLAALCGITPAARLFAHFSNQCWGLLGGILTAIDHPDWRLSAAAWPLPLSLCYWLGLAVSQRLGRWRFFCGLCAAALLFTLLRPPAVAAQRRPSLELLDVGQGDGLLLESGGRSFLIDAGKPPIGVTVIAALRARKIFRLQGCAATHQDSDHRGGMAAVMNALHCDVLYLPAGSENDPGMVPLLEITAARRIPVRMLAAGDTLMFDRGALRVLWPPPGRGDKPNDRGLVFLWENADFHALLTADIEAATERELAPGLPSGALLKIAHHGSKTSSWPDFLAAARPRIGLLSVGANNGYGHPHPDALARLAAADIPLIRTDLQGGIRVGRIGDFFKLETADGTIRYRSIRPATQPPLPVSFVGGGCLGASPSRASRDCAPDISSGVYRR